MKFSKKIFIPILLAIILISIFATVTISNSKYPLPNIQNSEIQAISIDYNKNLLLRPASNKDGKKILKLVKSIIKESSLGDEEGGIINDNFLASMSQVYPHNYYVEIPFARIKEISFKNKTIKCDVIVICPEENAIYYHGSDSYTLNKVTLKDAKFDKLQKFLSSLY